MKIKSQASILHWRKKSSCLPLKTSFLPYFIVKKSINGEELLSELRLLMKKLFPALFKSEPDIDPAIVLNPFPVQEDVLPILLPFIEFACSSIL